MYQRFTDDQPREVSSGLEVSSHIVMHGGM
jgi:hypothetical protein